MSITLRSLAVLTAMGAASLFSIADAASLGESIAKQNNISKSTQKALFEVKAGAIRFQVHRVALTQALFLPDCIEPRKIKPSDGRLIVLIEGIATNEGSESVSYECPKMVASDGTRHDVVDTLYYKHGGNDEFNPKETYPFVACYLMFPNLLKGSRLSFTDGELFGARVASASLPFNDNTQIEDKITLHGVTDNMFDVGDGLNQGEDVDDE